MSQIGRYVSAVRSAVAPPLIALAVAVGAHMALAAEETTGLFLQGEVSIPQEQRQALGEADRLVIKIYHPGRDGFEKDPKYTFRQASDLPMAFRVAPPIDMNGNARWPTFIVEAFTDNDGDVLSLNDGEFFATTGDPLPLGTEGIVLTLQAAE